MVSERVKTLYLLYKSYDDEIFWLSEYRISFRPKKKGRRSDPFFQNSVIFYDYLNFKFAEVMSTRPT